MRKGQLAVLAALAAEVDAGLVRRRIPKNIPVPDVGSQRNLGSGDQWKALLWSIDTAEQHSKGALRGISLALARIVQAKALEAHLFDVREPVRDGISVPECLWDQGIPLTSAGETLTTLPRKLRRGRPLDMAEAAVFPATWKRLRLIRALGNIGEGLPHGTWRQDPNHFGIEWRPWPILWVSNGNHSTLAGLVRVGGKFRPAETYDLSPVLAAVDTDGKHWFRRDTGEPFGKVNSMAMAGMWIVGQRLAGKKRAGHGQVKITHDQSKD